MKKMTSPIANRELPPMLSKGSLQRRRASTYVNMPVWTVTVRVKVKKIHRHRDRQELASNDFWDSVISSDEASSPFILSLSSSRHLITSNNGHYSQALWQAPPLSSRPRQRPTKTRQAQANEVRVCERRLWSPRYERSTMFRPLIINEELWLLYILKIEFEFIPRETVAKKAIIPASQLLLDKSRMR